MSIKTLNFLDNHKLNVFLASTYLSDMSLKNFKLFVKFIDIPCPSRAMDILTCANFEGGHKILTSNLKFK